MKKPKVIVVGLDGATWDLIKPWAEEGKLSTFRKIMEKGAWGILKSTVPPLSPSAWVSIYTGCKPSKHGVFGFVKRKRDSYFYRPISSKDIKKPTIWDILSKFGLRSIVINALFMYPPKPINGVLITGLGTPSKQSNFVYPSSYKKFIVKNFPKYDVDFNEDLLIVSDNAREFISKIKDVTIEQIKLTLYFIKNEKWDFLFSIFRALDVIQHFFWNNKELIFKFYKIIDIFLDNLIKLQDSSNDEYTLFLVSDHGFRPLKKYFCVNNWLEHIGMLKTIKTQRKYILTAETIKKIFLKLGMRDLVWKLKRSSWIEKVLKIIPTEELGYIYKIKWGETKAYYYEGSAGIININLEGREPLGKVSRKEYKIILDYIVNRLKELEDPETGENVVERVYTKEDLFGSNDLELPDIYFLLKPGYSAIGYNKISNSIFMSPAYERIPRSGDHDINGIFAAYGWNISSGQLKGEVKLWDIAPTILYILGVPIPPYMNGHVLTNIFQSVSAQHINYIQLEKQRIREKIKELRAMLKNKKKRN